jgi:glutamyl-Q tRNA(Asp) synthetase
LMNTHRQIYLQRLLGITTPSYFHVPLVRDGNGEKLSKQTLAHAISLDTPIETLQAAWTFLKQADLGRIESVAAFWKSAINAWNPQRLQGQTTPL